MLRRTRRPVAVVAAAVTLAGTLSGCGFTGLYSAPLPGGADLGDHPYSVTIEFADVLDLVPQSSVKVNDVAVGKVTDISLGDDHGKWVAKVKVSVNGSVKLPANARASVLQTSLLGEKYVSLMRPTSGASSTQLANKDLIPLSRTNSAAGVEQVLGALSLLLNEGGLRQIKSIAIELNKALGTPERQQATRDLIRQLDTFVGTLDNQKDGITTALEQIDKLAGTLNRNKAILTDALDAFPPALKVLNDERGKLVNLLKSLSRLGVVAKNVIDATQTSLVGALKNLDPVVRSLTAAGNDFPESLRIAGTFPFPLGLSRKFVRGDYANLDAILNLNLTDTLCGLTQGVLCLGDTGKSANLPLITQVVQTILGQAQGGGGGGILSTNTSSAAPLSPMLVGAGK